MKNTPKYILITAMALGTISCDLHNTPEDRLLPDNFFKNAASLESWLAPCYELFDNQSVILDDADDFIDNNLGKVTLGSRTASAQTWDWSPLTRVNYLIENADLCTDTLSAKKSVAKARFFRGLFYFEMARKYGNIPWYDKTIATDNEKLLHKRTDSHDYVMMKVLEDFKAAAEGLDAEVSAIPTEVNKWVALGFLARAALYEGTLLKYQGEDDWEEYLVEAVEACDEIIGSGLFKVHKEASWNNNNSYRNLFTMETMPATEALLERIYDTRNSTSEYYKLLTESQIGATRRFIYHYPLSDGSSISNRRGYETESYLVESAGRDPRLTQTILFPGAREAQGGREIVNNLNSLTGYQPIKFRRYPDDRTVNACFPILRYPEILLTLAEAKAELSSAEGYNISQEDLDNTVNLIRARVGIPALDLAKASSRPDALLERMYPNISKGANKGIILEIRRERTIELALEGHRLWDIFRWHEGAFIGNELSPLRGIYLDGVGLLDLNGDGQADVEIYTSQPSGSAINTLKLGSDIVLSEGDHGYVIAYAGKKLPEEDWDEDRDYLWPIPAIEFTIPGCRLVQNLGY